MKTMLSLTVSVMIFAGNAACAQSSAAQSQAVLQQAMRDCEHMYRGARRGSRWGMGNFVYSYIERCFKSKTGVFPSQANINCRLRYC